MKKAAVLTLAVLLGFAVPAFADTALEKADDISSDAGAIHKDNAAISHDQSNLAANRAAKARHKANGDWGNQAVDSVKIGANKSAISEKKTEKDVDHEILEHHEEK